MLQREQYEEQPGTFIWFSFFLILKFALKLLSIFFSVHYTIILCDLQLSGFMGRKYWVLTAPLSEKITTRTNGWMLKSNKFKLEIKHISLLLLVLTIGIT